MSTINVVFADEIEQDWDDSPDQDDSRDRCMNMDEWLTNCICCSTTWVGILVAIAIIITLLGKRFGIKKINL